MIRAMESSGYRLTESLPYLLNRVGVRMGELFGNELAADGMTLPGYRVLAALAEVDEQRLVDLCAMTSIEMTTLSRLVAALEGRRLLRRRRPKDNLRTVQISLLPAGRTLLARLQPRAEHYERAALASMGVNDVRAFKDALRAIYDSLDEIEREQGEPKAAPARPARRTAA